MDSEEVYLVLNYNFENSHWFTYWRRRIFIVVRSHCKERATFYLLFMFTFYRLKVSALLGSVNCFENGFNLSLCSKGKVRMLIWLFSMFTLDAHVYILLQIMLNIIIYKIIYYIILLYFITVPKIFKDTGFFWLVISHIRTESTNLPLYRKI